MKYQHADLILMNGNIITMNEKTPSAEAVAVKGDKIIFVGAKEGAQSYKDKSTKIVDMNGKTLMPGFIESHAHPMSLATSLIEIDCRPEKVKSIEDIKNLVRKQTELVSEDQWIIGRGWDDNELIEKRNITRYDLDKVSPNHPVFLKRRCGHIAVVNSKALEISNISKDISFIQGGHIQKDRVTGEPTGILQERALELIETPKYSISDLRKGLMRAQNEFAKWGITTVHDLSTQKLELQTYQSLLDSNDLTVRYRLWLWALPHLFFPGVQTETINLGIQSDFGNNYIKVQGLKYMLDGSLSGKTAAVHDSYSNDKNNLGILYYEKVEIIQHILSAIRSNLRVSMHAIGDRAIDQSLEIFEEINREISIKYMRNRIEHGTLINKDHIQRVKNLGIVIGSSIGFLYPAGDSYIENIGFNRVNDIFPHRIYKEEGIVAPGNSDSPVYNGNPFLGIYSLVTRKTKKGTVIGEHQSVSVKEALKAYTIDGAYSSFEEDTLGSIEVGKLADMIVISDNPFYVDHEHLKEIEVVMTIMDGKIVYEK